MFLSVDIAGIGQHLELLQREKKEASRLISALNAWRNAAALDDHADLSRISYQIGRVVRHREWIQSRINYLEELRQRSIRMKDRVSTDLNSMK